MMTFSDAASAQAAERHLSAAMGDRIKVNAVWNEQKQKFVKKK